MRRTSTQMWAGWHGAGRLFNANLTTHRARTVRTWSAVECGTYIDRARLPTTILSNQRATMNIRATVEAHIRSDGLTATALTLGVSRGAVRSWLAGRSYAYTRRTIVARASRVWAPPAAPPETTEDMAHAMSNR